MSNKQVSQILFNNHPLYFREGTSDAFLIRMNLLAAPKERDYVFPVEAEPKIIFDIGANIGTTAILLDHCYPGAVIYAFEPEPENFELLKKNVGPYPNIHVFNFGLGSKDKEVHLYQSETAGNFGGYSQFKDTALGDVRLDPVKIRDISAVLAELKVDRIDVIKIDTEGSESDILTALDPELLASVRWIEGELHGRHDDWFLLECLSSMGFKLGVKKHVLNRNMIFQAANQKITERFHGGFQN